MKRTLSFLAMGGAVTFLSMSTSCAGPINGSFESGNFAGWQLNMARGYSAFEPNRRAAGTAAVLANWHSASGAATQSAADGQRFAALGTLANGNFIGNRNYSVSLDQTLQLAAGEIITGWAAFYNGDYTAQDHAWVKVFNESCDLVATPWGEISGSQPARDFNSTPYRTLTPWMQWSWQAPETGQYTLSFGVTSQGDNNFASYGFFDGALRVPPTLPIPEPSSLSVLAIGGALLALGRRQRRISV